MIKGSFRTSCSIAVATALIAGCGMMKSRDERAGGMAARPSQATVTTVGDVLAMGGRQVTASEARELFNGASWSGVTSQGGAYTVQTKGSGKYTGTATTKDGSKANFEGDWWIDNEGRHCSSNAGQTTQTRTECYYYFRAGDRSSPEYYMSESNSSQSRVLPRRITR